MTPWQLQTPVVFLIFRRPDTTARVFAEIARARPPKLLVVADGPRADRPDEAEQCAAARAIIEQVDWPCEVLTNYAETNMGCGRRVASGLDWAFSLVEEAIILEDDCLPHPTFFRYCEELLERYRDDERVMVVSGDNFQQGKQRTEYSYYFSRYPHCWGWATWRRAWRHYDHEMRLWPMVRDNGVLHDVLGDEPAVTYWSHQFQQTYAGSIDTWNYRWTLNCWLQHGLTALPNVNLVSNIGFGEDSTHTKGSLSVLTEALQFPIQHPAIIFRNVQADAFTDYYHFHIRENSHYQRLKNKASRVGSITRHAVRSALITGFTLKPQAKLQLRRLKRRLTGKSVSPEYAEYERVAAELNGVPRYTERQVTVNGWHLNIPDAASFLSAYNEIFVHQIYTFPSDKRDPCIIDVGANIGLSILFFKHMYPDARIIAFEADPYIYHYLERNIRENGLSDVILINQAVWDSKTTLSFFSERADAGRIALMDDDCTVEVSTVDIKDILQNYSADFLKIDIEGAEEVVLPASRDFLSKIPFVFVEYHAHRDKPQELHKLLSILAECGFRVYVSPVISCRKPFLTPPHYLGFDLQLNIYARNQHFEFTNTDNL